ncbi:atherin-like [Choloepus didactylus]|uniref:atherin-like n=1 Tax=Choloepus didactylus TaxID=27675 RepID=UPI00189E0155|nr:atherin-like [Choloepus didactylus]
MEREDRVIGKVSPEALGETASSLQTPPRVESLVESGPRYPYPRRESSGEAPGPTASLAFCTAASLVHRASASPEQGPGPQPLALPEHRPRVCKVRRRILWLGAAGREPPVPPRRQRASPPMIASSPAPTVGRAPVVRPRWPHTGLFPRLADPLGPLLRPVSSFH